MSDLEWDLDTTAKEAIIKNRIIQLAKDGYQLELNYKFALSQNNQEATDKFKASVEGVKASLEFHKEELAKLNA
jgi:hypothetical protein